jgi:hypothetical protein
MKVFLQFLLLMSCTLTHAGMRGDLYLPSHSGVRCPHAQETDLKVETFAPSADSRSKKGQCKVEVPAYSWWDLSSSPHEAMRASVEVEACDSSEFLMTEQGTFIKATVAYVQEISRCESILGCHYQCKPIVTLGPL